MYTQVLYHFKKNNVYSSQIVQQWIRSCFSVRSVFVEDCFHDFDSYSGREETLYLSPCLMYGLLPATGKNIRQQKQIFYGFLGLKASYYHIVVYNLAIFTTFAGRYFFFPFYSIFSIIFCSYFFQTDFENAFLEPKVYCKYSLPLHKVEVRSAHTSPSPSLSSEYIDYKRKPNSANLFIWENA